MSERKTIIPEFAPFAGMRVISAGSIVAMPVAGTLLADFGAEVLHIERPGVGDTFRVLAPFVDDGDKKVSSSWAQQGRNRLSLSLELNLKKYPEVKELFFDLIREADIFMENLVWTEKLGIYDEELLEINPKLIIVHVSGYGNPKFGGIPEICDRASYDMIGQAFSGWLSMQAKTNGEPAIAKPWTNDYISVYQTLFGVLAAYINMLKTGKGQVVDIAQYEAMGVYQCDNFTTYAETGVMKPSTGNKSAAFQPYGMFKSKDGYDVVIGAFGPGVYNRSIQAMGFDLDYYTFKACASGVPAVSSDIGRELDQKVIAWCAERTAQEIEDIMAAHKVPCSRVNTVKDCLENEHFIKRENFIKYEDQTLGREITAWGITPKLSGTPGKVWRGAPSVGQDTDAILTDILGYDAAKIQALKDKKLI